MPRGMAVSVWHFGSSLTGCGASADIDLALDCSSEDLPRVLSAARRLESTGLAQVELPEAYGTARQLCRPPIHLVVGEALRSLSHPITASIYAGRNVTAEFHS